MKNEEKAAEAAFSKENIDGVEVTYGQGLAEEGPEALAAYVKWAKERFGDDVEELLLEPDGDYVNVSAKHAEHEPFERIRRITGYLVGSLDRFNDAKRAEVADRVTHPVDAKGSAWRAQAEKNRKEAPAGTPYAHGSQSEDELRARMRDAGWEEWETEEEIDERNFAFAMEKQTPVYDPARIIAERLTLGNDSAVRAADALVASGMRRSVPMRGNAEPANPAAQEAQSRSAAEAAERKESQDARKPRR